MGLTITTPARDRRLVGLTEVKTRLGISGSTEDTELALWIDDASSAIVVYLGYDLALQSYTEVLGGGGRVRLYLSRRPIDPDSVTVTIRGTAKTDFQVEDKGEGLLQRLAGFWPLDERASWDVDGVAELSIAYKGGYVLPGWTADWAIATAKVVGDWVRPTLLSDSALRFECTTAGTTHATTEPTWSSLAAGGTVADGTATWTARDSSELPEVIRAAAAITVRRFRSGDAGAGLLSQRAGDMAETYSQASAESLLPLEVRRSLMGFRR